MRPESTKPVDVDVIAAEYAGTITLFGATHQVKQADGHAYKFAKAAAEGTADIMDGYAVARRLVPSLPEGRELDLTGAQINAILLVADQNIAAVEAAFPNAVRPTETTPSSPSA